MEAFIAPVVLLTFLFFVVFGLVFFSILVWSTISVGRINNTLYNGKEEDRYPWSS